MQVSITLPPRLPHQADVLDDAARFKVVVFGRRGGKTTGIGLPAVLDGHGPRDQAGVPRWRGAIHGRRIWWVTKTHGVAADIWRQLKGATEGAWIDKSEVERRIVLPGGGEVTVKSGEEPDSLRGAGLDGVVLDEAAFMAGEVWHVIRPALSDRGGWAIFISTPNALERPRGDWFEELFNDAPNRGESWARWQKPTAANPIIPADELDEAQRALPAIVYRQEYLAEFVTLEGARFRRDWFRYWQPAGDGFRLLRLEGAVVVPGDEGQRFATMDLAASVKSSADYTVIAACHVTPARDLILLDMDRRRLEGPDQLPALRAMIDRWRLGNAWIERTGYQLAFVQTAVRAGLPARPLAADKDKVARALPLEARMQAGTVYFPQGAPWLVDLERELLAFTGDPKGKDDMVDALAYAAIVIAHGTGAPRVLSFSG